MTYFPFHRSQKQIQIAYISQDMLKFSTNLSLMNEDLHVFVPKDFKQTKNIYDDFIRLYDLREKWNHEYWLLDSSRAGHKYLQNLKLDLDDDLYIYDYKEGKSIKIYEFYEIHATRPKKLNYYGNWNSKNGLNIPNQEKWDRRKNLQVSYFTFSGQVNTVN